MDAPLGCEPLPGNDRPCPDVVASWSNPDNNPYPNYGREGLRDLVAVGNDTAVVVGFTWLNEDDGSSGDDWALVAFNPADGSVRWQSRYRSPGIDFPQDAALTPAGDALVVVGVSGFGGPAVDFPVEGTATVAAFDPVDGTLLWVHHLDLGGPGIAQAVAIGPGDPASGGPTAFVTSTMNASGPDGYETDVVTTALRLSDQKVLWQVRHDDPAHADNPESIQRQDLAREILLSPSGDRVYVAADSSGSELDFLALGYDADSGALLWRTRYDGPIRNSDHVQDAGISGDGKTLVLTGYLQGDSGSTGTGFDFGTVAFDTADGRTRWSRTYRGAANAGQNVAFDLLIHGDRVYVAGPASSARLEHDYDYGVVTYRLADGTDALPPLQYDGGTRLWDVATVLAISPAGDELYVGGYSQTVPGSVLGLSMDIGWTGPAAIRPYQSNERTLALDTTTGQVLWAAEYNSDETGLDSDYPRVAELTPDGKTLMLGTAFYRGHDLNWRPTGTGWNTSDIGLIGYRLGEPT